MRNNSIDMNKKQKVEIDNESKSDTDLNSSSLMIHGMDSNNSSPGSGAHEPECCIILFTKSRKKKKKSFDDGVVVSKQNKLILHDMEGAVVHQINFKYEKLPSGRVIISGQLEIEIQNEIPIRDFQSGKVLIGMTSTCTTAAATTNNAGTQNSNVQIQRPNSMINEQFVAVVSSNIQSKVSNTTVSKAAMSLHSADTPGACVLKLADPAKGTVDIVIDPTIASYLRPHQRDGVKFMFDCLTSEKFGGHDCILADEMGLGKTIQSIALIWTLMKQGPQGHAKPYCFKAIVVCPSSLVDNWGNEVRKLLGQERLMSITVNVTGETAKKAVEEFKVTRVRRLLIISYETLRKYIPLIQQIPGIELLICDEGHRLKSAAGNKTISALQSIKTKRRVLLTGTPVQNQLDEFYAMVSFVHPDAIGKDPRNFKAIFQTPIEQGRDKNATAEQIEIAEARSKQLQELTSYFF